MGSSTFVVQLISYSLITSFFIYEASTFQQLQVRRCCPSRQRRDEVRIVFHQHFSTAEMPW